MFIRGREDLIINIHRKTATAQKRVKTEEPEPSLIPSLAMFQFSGGIPHESGEITKTVSLMRDSITRLESQVCSQTCSF